MSLSAGTKVWEVLNSELLDLKNLENHSVTN